MSQTQTGKELDRRTQPRTYYSKDIARPESNVQKNNINQMRQGQLQITNNEPNSTLYILTPNVKAKQPVPPASSSMAGRPQMRPQADPRQKSVALAPVRTVQKPQDRQTQTNAKKQSPVKRLAYRFQKGGLGMIDSYFNAYYFYYDWKSEKTGRKPRDYMETVAQHPRGWSVNKSCGDVFEENTYDKYLAFLTLIAKLWGFICILFKPAYNFFRSVTDFFATFANASKASKNIGYIAQKAFAFLLPALSVIFTAVTILNISSFKPQFELTFNGQNIGFVDSKETVGRVISLLENTVSSVLNEPYEFTGNLSYRIVLTKSKSYVSESDLYNLMHNSDQIQNAITTAYGLYIDGELVGAAENQSDINRVLNEILEENAGDIDDGTIEFANEIKIIENKYAKRDVVTQDELKDIITYVSESLQSDTDSENLRAGPESEDEYIIADAEIPLADGNSLFSEYSEYSDEPSASASSEDIAAIAAASSINLTPEAINTIPRGFLMLDESSRQDEVLSRLSRTSGSTTAGSIQFKKVKTESYTVEVPFEVKYVDSDRYYTGTQTVQTNGVNGENMITADVTYIGENEISREIKQIEKIREPVNKVILVGTKVKPVAAPTGGFIRPVKGGYISTYYKSGHRAIDIPVPYGTTVVASDGGTVIYAGIHSSYGNYVKITHSNGFVTLYAHLSSISVSYGDKVFQGQEIGKAGSTGYSTGNHVHFEVIKNGVQVDPLLYIK